MAKTNLAVFPIEIVSLQEKRKYDGFTLLVVRQREERNAHGTVMTASFRHVPRILREMWRTPS